MLTAFLIVHLQYTYTHIYMAIKEVNKEEYLFSAGVFMVMWIFQVNCVSCSVGLAGLSLDSVLPCLGLGHELISV